MGIRGDARGCRRGGGGDRVGVHDVYAAARHGCNDGMAPGVGSDCAKGKLLVVGRSGGSRGHAGATGMAWLQNPADLEGQAVLVGVGELVAAVWHVGDRPAAQAVVQAYVGGLGDALVALASAEDADDVAGVPLVLV